MINKIILVGRLGKDPILHTTQSGKTVVKFTVATWENFRDEKEESGWRTETEWSNVVVWGDSATSFSQKTKKGDLVYVEGKIKTRSYEDKDKNTKYITEIIGYAKNLTPKDKPAESTAGKSAGAKVEPSTKAESPEKRAQRLMDESDLPY